MKEKPNAAVVIASQASSMIESHTPNNIPDLLINYHSIQSSCNDGAGNSWQILLATKTVRHEEALRKCLLSI